MTPALTIGSALLYMWALIQSLPFAAAYFGGSYIKAIVWAAVAMAAILIAGAAAARRLGPKSFLLLLVAASLAVRLGWVLWIDTPPVSDFKDMYDAAVRGAGGDFSFAGNEYFSRWAYLVGFTLYETVVVKLFGASVLVLKLLNAVFGAATAVVVYRIGKACFNAYCGRIAALLYAFYLPNIMMCSVLTNQHLSTLLFTLGCGLLATGRLRSRFGWLWIGLLFAAGQIIRPLGAFYVVAAVVYGLVWLVRRPENARRTVLLARLAGLAVVYFVVLQLVGQLLIGAGIARYPLAAQEPYWKFMVGLNRETTGGWSQADTDYALSFPLGSVRDEAELTLLRERLRTVELKSLLWDKARLLWGADDASAYWSLYQTKQAQLQADFNRAERAFYLAMAAFGVIGALALLRRRAEERGYALFALLLVGYAAIHLVIEIQTRYRLDMMPAFVLLQSFGIYTVHQWMQTARQHIPNWRHSPWKKSRSL
ncbi:glycosyltransferase family 39 protein [Cohnella nanjingensis]|uniref:Glycosyltransferase family 39 protein n=1 Tax=Cohnella nanjingensis TaxID=1387779 RepID=A0A7X0VJU3_9BACL|nr:glycosyltransferase family 39 protein [Cohnella nanjingensis]MBB6675099.1 glycosyltransferase family 39 protein [Cohnella nanjingensis]